MIIEKIISIIEKKKLSNHSLRVESVVEPNQNQITNVTDQHINRYDPILKTLFRPSSIQYKVKDVIFL